MALHGTAPALQKTDTGRRARHAWADNLKVILVAGVIVGHATIAWTNTGSWVVYETPVRQPLLTILMMAMLVGVLFAMPLLFMIAGLYTAPSLQQKGLRRFLIDRVVRLGVPIMVFVLLLAPVIEYVDTDNAGWERGFLAFTPTMWWPWPPAWGPLWFLAVLLLFSVVYAAVRSVFPARTTNSSLRGWHLVAAAAVLALASYLLRLQVPFGEEVHRLALAQAPAWITGFVLGVLGGERGWFTPVPSRIAAAARRVAWVASAALMVTVAAVTVTGADPEVFAGGGTWQSLVLAMLEGVLVVAMPLWLIEEFQRRWNRQGSFGRVLSRAAYGAFIVHQIVLLGWVLASRSVPLPPEIAYVIVSALAVVTSFGLGALAARLPGVSRVV